ncbi:MAG: septum formation inhibitor Maf [Bacteroidota bacterium]
MQFLIRFGVVSILAATLAGCAEPSADTTDQISAEEARVLDAPVRAELPTANPGSAWPDLDPYWYQGKAEISTYDLQQVRYGAVHPGELTLIFVTEDFLTDKQVKNDRYQNPNSTKVLKTNQLRRFTTGVYDYSVMSSVFTPVKRNEEAYTLKVTTSAQDWCGQSFSQLNYDDGQQYRWQWNSYFEVEGDRSGEVQADLIEDEILNLIRMGGAPTLPRGNIDVLPPLEALLLNHLPVEPVPATAQVAEYAGDPIEGTTDLMTYTIAYPSLGRELAITFERESPYRIERIRTQENSRGRELTTLAQRRATELLPYWQMNKPSDVDRRADLGFE